MDETRDPVILEAALDVLAETGYAGMTMSLVAARARAGKGALYRRWKSKEDLIIDAVAHMTQRDVDIASLPDTGSLRGDILGLIHWKSLEEADRRLRVLAGLVSMAAAHDGIGEAIVTANSGPWIAANRTLIQRAIDRGEGRPDANADVLARVIPAMCAALGSLERRPITPEFITELLDEIVLPAVLVRP